MSRPVQTRDIVLTGLVKHEVLENINQVRRIRDQEEKSRQLSLASIKTMKRTRNNR